MLFSRTSGAGNRTAAPMHGVNPHRWFYDFKIELAQRADRVARIFGGPAIERWLSAEMYGYLASTLPRTLTCRGESSTTDLAVYRVKDDARVASIEVKLVYRGHSVPTVASYARKLCWQVLGNRQHAAPTNVGFIYAAYVLPSTLWARKRGTLEEFRRAAGAAIREVCTEMNVPCAKESMETVIGERVATVGGSTYNFGLVGQYVMDRT